MSHTVCDILFAKVDELRKMARSKLTRNAVRLQIEYMLLGVPSVITEARLGAVFSKICYIEDVSASSSKAEIAIGNNVLEITMTILGLSSIEVPGICRVSTVNVDRC